MIVTNAPTEQVHKLMVQPYDDEESTVGERIRKAGFICCESSTKTSEPLDAS